MGNRQKFRCENAETPVTKRVSKMWVQDEARHGCDFVIVPARAQTGHEPITEIYAKKYNFNTNKGKTRESNFYDEFSCVFPCFAFKCRYIKGFRTSV